MIKYKESIYNYTIPYKSHIIYYNSLSDKILIFSKEENIAINDLLKNLQKFLSEYPTLFKLFIKNNFIVEDTFNEKDYYLFKYIEKNRQDTTYKITINPTLDCNFNCWYCSVSSVGAKIKNSRMTDIILHNIKLHIENKIKENRFNKIIIDWFGGEPMLYYDKIIKPLAVFLKEKCIQNNMSFAHFITTNGFLIDKKIITEFNLLKIKYFQITLDGNEKKHNSIRNNGQIGSFKTIINNLKLISNNIENSEVVIRINYDKKTLKRINGLFVDLQGINKEKVIFDFQRVWQVTKTKEENELLSDVINIFEQEGYKVIHPKWAPKKFYRCMFDKKEHIVINYDGNLYKCTARDYSDKYKVGRINNFGELDFNGNYYNYNKQTILDECLECKHLPLCAGPCIQHKYEYLSGEINFDSTCIINQSEISINTFIINKAEILLKT